MSIWFTKAFIGAVLRKNGRWMGTLMSDLWYQDQVSLGAKRDSRQEASPVALIVTRYPILNTYEKREGKAVCLHL